MCFLWPIVSAIELTASYAIDFICHEKHKKAQKDEVAEINELCAVVRQTRSSIETESLINFGASKLYVNKYLMPNDLITIENS